MLALPLAAATTVADAPSRDAGAWLPSLIVLLASAVVIVLVARAWFSRRMGRNDT
jgi:hypothetical protein